VPDERRRALGQNFLTDERAIADVVGTLHPGCWRSRAGSSPTTRADAEVLMLVHWEDAHFKRPLWFVRGEGALRRDRVLDWDVLADTPANRALALPR
jgi:hypothetical protein